MNKIFFFLLTFFWCIFSAFSFAEKITMQVPFSSLPLDSLNDVWMRFCDDGMSEAMLTKKENLILRPGQSQEVCMLFFNSSAQKKVEIFVGLGSWVLTPSWQISCDTDISTGNSFSSLWNFEGSHSLSLPQHSQIIKKVRVSVPSSYSWNIYGCLWYQLDQKRPKDYTWMFLFVNRKVVPIHLTVTWDVYTLQRLDDAKFFVKDHQLLLLEVLAWFFGILLVYYIIQAVLHQKKSMHTPKHKK